MSNRKKNYNIFEFIDSKDSIDDHIPDLENTVSLHCQNFLPDRKSDFKYKNNTKTKKNISDYVPSNHSDYVYRHKTKEKKKRKEEGKKGNVLNFLNKKKKIQAEHFRYGNFHYYYGYRNQGEEDSRIMCMKKEWFVGKRVLDIGCNAGHFTLTVAKNFSPQIIIGIDIDGNLIQIAKKNVRNYLSPEVIHESDLPISFVICYGPYPQAALHGKSTDAEFPYNVGFIQANYILESDELVKMQRPYFNTILCLSLTKWIHLNWGDCGIKRLFHRMYAQLQPGGFLILEAQPFKTYSRKKKINDIIFKNYQNIKLFPENFNEYLLKEVGFKSCELIDTPAHTSKGFSRPLYLFIKEDSNPKLSNEPLNVIFNDDIEAICNIKKTDELSD